MSEKEQIKLLKEKIELLEQKLSKQNQNETIKNNILIQQSQMAAIGEMMENIAYQYKQPLMEISSLFVNTEAKIRLFGSISNDDILEMIEKSNIALKYLATTIDDFRVFYAKDKVKSDFFISEAVSSCVNIMHHTLLKENIKLNLVIKNNCKIFGFRNEFVQVIINILTNAIDSIVLNKVKDGLINIKLFKDNKESIIQIEDNGGGIKCKPIQKVFEPFFSYKKSDSTGIGLFMSKLIIEKNMNGLLSVTNNLKGASFKIIL